MQSATSVRPLALASRSVTRKVTIKLSDSREKRKHQVWQKPYGGIQDEPLYYICDHMWNLPPQDWFPMFFFEINSKSGRKKNIVSLILQSSRVLASGFE